MSPEPKTRRNLLDFLPEAPEFAVAAIVGIAVALIVAGVGTFLQWALPHSIALVVLGIFLIAGCAVVLSSTIKSRLKPVAGLPASIGRILDERLPPTRFVDGAPQTLDAMLTVVRGASSFISATGSKSRKVEYLDAIEAKLTAEKDVVYHRIVFGVPLTRELCSHLCRLLQNPATRPRTNAAWLDQPDLGYFTVSDAGVIVFMPDPFDPRRDITRCLHVSAEQREIGRLKIIRELDKWIVHLWGEATHKLKTPDDVKKRCENYHQGSHQHHN